jgi:hypothetical protein
MTANTPAHAAGAVTVTVTNPGGAAASLTNGYTFMTPSSFQDDPIVQYSTLVRAQHILDLRAPVANIWAAAGLGSPSWTNSVSSGSIIRSVDVQELRTKLNQGRQALGYSTISVTDDPLVSGQTTIKKEHVDQLRDGIRLVTN